MSTHVRTIRHRTIQNRRSLLLTGLTLLIWCGAACVASAANLCVNPGGTLGCKSTIGAAVAAASAGDTIVVASGTYKEEVTITKPLSLVAPGERAAHDRCDRPACRHIHQRDVRST